MSWMHNVGIQYLQGFQMGNEIYLYDKDYTVIEMNGKRLFIISSEKAENVFEKAKECDIIIKYGENDPEDNTIMQCDAKIVELYEGKRVTVAF